MIGVKAFTFFESDKVLNAAGNAKRRALRNFGAYTRTVARRSIRKRKSVSQPGKPPSSHTGLLRRFILFGYDALADSVVIGPAGFGRARVPRLLEEGGQETARRPIFIPPERNTGAVRRVKAGGRSTGRGWVRIEKGTRLTYRPRPYMGPAFATAQGRLHLFWKDALRPWDI